MPRSAWPTRGSPRSSPGCSRAGADPAAVFRGDDGLDELTLATTSTVWWVRDGAVTQLTLDPSDVGLERSPVEALRGGDAEHNAQVARDLLAGARGPVRDAVVLNAGIALATASGLAEATVVAGRRSRPRCARAWTARRSAIDSGAARDLLARWVEVTRSQPAERCHRQPSRTAGARPRGGSGGCARGIAASGQPLSPRDRG